MSSTSPEPVDPQNALRTEQHLTHPVAAADQEMVTAAIDAGWPLGEILELVVERACVLLAAAEVFILLREGDRLIGAAQRGLDAGDPAEIQLRIDEPVEGWAVQHQRPLIMPDPYTDPRFRELPQRQQRAGAIVAVPLQSHGQVLGTLTIVTATAAELAEKRLIWMLLAEVAALAIEGSRTRAREARRPRLVELLRFVAETSFAPDLAAALQPVADRISEVLEAEKVDVVLYDAARDVFVSMGVSQTPLGRKQREVGLDVIPAEAPSLMGYVFETGKSVLVYDARQDARIYPPIVHELGVRSLVISPLAAHGERRGVVECTSTRLAAFGSEEQMVLDLIAHRLSLAMQNLEREAQRSQAAADEETSLGGAFLELLVHDLKNPLASLKGYAQLAARRLELGDRAYVARALRILDEKADQMTGLINEALDVTRLTAGTFQLTPDVLDLAALLRAEVEAVQTTTAQHAIGYDGPDTLTVTGDRSRLAEVFQNLLSNAVQYSPGGAVTVTLAPRDGVAEVAVCDEGMGIAPEDLPHLFERAFRGRGTQRRGGHGLGLYISREIVRLHGGQISAESRPQGGACFRVVLPL